MKRYIGIVVLGLCVAVQCPQSLAAPSPTTTQFVLTDSTTAEQADAALDYWESKQSLSEEDILAIISYLGFKEPVEEDGKRAEEDEPRQPNNTIGVRAKALLNTQTPTNLALYTAVEEQLNNPVALYHAAFILRRWSYSHHGDEMTSRHVRRLGAEDVHVAGEMEFILRGCVIKKEEDVEFVAKMLESADPIARTRAAMVIDFQAIQSNPAILGLESRAIECLKDEDAQVRAAAAGAVNELGRMQEKSHCQLTIPLLRDPDAKVQLSVRMDLLTYDLTPLDYEQLGKVLMEGDSEAQFAALHLIATGDGRAQRAVSALIACQGKRELEATALEALPRIVGDEHRQAYDLLEYWAASNDEYIRMLAVRATARLLAERHDDKAVEILVKCINGEGSPRIARYLLDVLWQELDEDTFINQVWWHCLRSDTPGICLAALSHGHKLQRPIQSYMGQIVQRCMEHPNPKIREEARRLWPEIEDLVLPE